MKKVYIVLLAMAMSLFLAACGSESKVIDEMPDVDPVNGETQVTDIDEVPSTELTNDDDLSSSDNQNSASVNETDPADDQTGSAEVVTEFVPNEDLRVVAAFNYDNDTYVVVENMGEQAILNYRVAYISFDKNGLFATRDSDGYETGKHDTANIMPGEKNISSWYGADGDYTIAAVISVDYQDGHTWEAEQLDTWVENARSEFNVDTHKAGLANLAAFNDAAEANDYATLTDYTIKHGNRFSSDHDLHFSIKNTSDQGITGLNVFVLEFDENGFPVSVSPYDTYCMNGHQTGGTVNLAAGQSGSYSDDLFISPTTTQIKVVISYIEFQDGTDWMNPYIYEWIISNNGMY